jgi:DNA-binding NarL/FixJ family response regulator
VRPTKVLYIENDPALRSLLAGLLKTSSQLEIVDAFGTVKESLDPQLVRRTDVALINFGLDHDTLNGIELGIAFRSINENIGIVIYSHIHPENMLNRVPENIQPGWSFFSKSSTMQLSDYVSILKNTARGKGNWQEAIQSHTSKSNDAISILSSLTPRQRSIIAMAAKGVSSREIAAELNLSYSFIRKELSKAYGILIPNADKSVDQKVLAIAKYRSLVKGY